MKKSIKLSLIVILILILVCAGVVIWHPWKKGPAKQESSLASSSVSQTIESSQIESSSHAQPDSSSAANSSPVLESSTDSELSSGLVPEDQPDSPDLNFETSGSSYDDIMVNVLTCLLTQDMAGLSSYTGSQGLRLSPTGTASDRDVVLSSQQVSDFFSLGTRSYGTYPGSGETISCSPQEYYSQYICPDGFDFSAASIAYNDASDLERVNGTASNPKTVSYYYAPNVMEWKRLILVYDSSDSGDVLSGIIYQDLTTD